MLSPEMIVITMQNLFLGASTTLVGTALGIVAIIIAHPLYFYINSCQYKTKIVALTLLMVITLGISMYDTKLMKMIVVPEKLPEVSIVHYVIVFMGCVIGTLIPAVMVLDELGYYKKILNYNYKELFTSQSLRRKSA